MDQDAKVFLSRVKSEFIVMMMFGSSMAYFECFEMSSAIDG